MKTAIWLGLSACFIAGAGHAQYSDGDPGELGDKAFKNRDYYEAAYYYRKAAEGMNMVAGSAIPYQASASKSGKRKSLDRLFVAYRLAESYRLYENYLEAEAWYNQVVNDQGGSAYPLARLWYGVCLRANNRMNEASTQLQQFLSLPVADAEARKLAESEIANCRFALEQYRYPVLADVQKLGGLLNADGSNYSSSRLNGQFYFTSSRQQGGAKKRMNAVYIAGESTDVTPVDFSDPNPGAAEYGTPSVSRAGDRIYLTRWSQDDGKNRRVICRADRANGKWVLRNLNANVNAPGFNAMQPFISPDGTTLYFVSDKPGGAGRYDIWVSSLDQNGDPQGSANAGKTINTDADEQAPWVDIAKNRLIFSSKGHTGMGGFDVFESKLGANGWSAPANMGYPVNSSKDDLYYVPYGDPGRKELFYLSSDRNSECCLELFSGSRSSVILSGKIVSCATNAPLDGAIIKVTDSVSGRPAGQLTTRADGNFSFTTTTSAPLVFSVEKPGFFSKKLVNRVPGSYSQDTLYTDICLQAFDVGRPIVLKNILFDFGSPDLREESKRSLDGLAKILRENPALRVELAAHTDSVGSDDFNLKLSSERAEACVAYLRAQGIADDRLFPKGYGRRRPVAPNTLPNGKDNPDGRQLNRRTEFTVLTINAP